MPLGSCMLFYMQWPALGSCSLLELALLSPRQLLTTVMHYGEAAAWQGLLSTSSEQYRGSRVEFSPLPVK